MSQSHVSPVRPEPVEGPPSALRSARPVRRALALLSFLAPAAALACPVCGQVSEQGQGAYLAMTFIISALPLVTLGAIGFWVVRRVLRQDGGA